MKFSWSFFFVLVHCSFPWKEFSIISSLIFRMALVENAVQFVWLCRDVELFWGFNVFFFILYVDSAQHLMSFHMPDNYGKICLGAQWKCTNIHVYSIRRIKVFINWNVLTLLFDHLNGPWIKSPGTEYVWICICICGIIHYRWSFQIDRIGWNKKGNDKLIANKMCNVANEWPLLIRRQKHAQIFVELKTWQLTSCRH